jgi:CheY-like chemotaxis protein/two-component sensor histidine kinase
MLAKGLRVIDKNARAQAKLIEDILDVSRIITGKLRLELRPLELESVVRASLEVIRPTADAKGVELHVSIEARPSVSGDPDRLQQVVWNLLSNAVKFTPQGGHVRLTMRRERGHAVLAVRDDGRGIEPEFLPFVFDPFRQADSSPTRHHGGLGLGLSIVRHLVELHGGSVRAESDGLGRGAVFIVRLPARDNEEHELASIRDTDPGGRHLRLDGLAVVVVDDEPDARELVAAMLTAAGARVTVAASAAEALEAIARSAPDVLVSDVGMPGEDGYDLIRKVRAAGAPLARLPAVALTAYASGEDARRAVLAGFHTHLPKPAEPAMLTAVIASLAGRLGH